MDSLNNTDFKKLARQQKTIQMKLLALEHFKEGKSRTQIAKYLKVSRTSVNKWVSVFLEDGLKGLKKKPCSGRPAFLTLNNVSSYPIILNLKLKTLLVGD